jgi:hypothetical protein
MSRLSAAGRSLARSLSVLRCSDAVSESATELAFLYQLAFHVSVIESRRSPIRSGFLERRSYVNGAKCPTTSADNLQDWRNIDRIEQAYGNLIVNTHLSISLYIDSTSPMC